MAAGPASTQFETEDGERPSNFPGKRHRHHLPHVFPDSWDLHSTRGIGRQYFSPTYAAHEDSAVPGHLAVWTSRRHRKGRYPLLKPNPTLVKDQLYEVVHERPKGILAPWGYRLIGWEPNNISYWVALSFTTGSVVWVVNGAFAFWPLHNETKNFYVLGYTGLVGGTLFLIGSILGVLELFNSPPEVDWGHEVVHDIERKQIIVRHQQSTQRRTNFSHRHSSADAQARRFANGHYGAEMGPLKDERVERNDLTEGGKDKQLKETSSGSGDFHDVDFRSNSRASHSGRVGDEAGSSHSRQLQWKFCVWRPRSLAWWTVMSQMIGATIFGIAACITGVPKVLPEDDVAYWRVWDGLFWAPQVVGSLFFILNGYLVMVESQHKWFAVKLDDLGWHSGFWNLLGAVGFLLSGVFGFFVAPVTCCQHWGTAFSTLWGSVFFLMGSYLLLPELLNK